MTQSHNMYWCYRFFIIRLKFITTRALNVKVIVIKYVMDQNNTNFLNY